MTSKMRSLYLEGYDYSIFDLTKPDRVQIQVAISPDYKITKPMLFLFLINTLRARCHDRAHRVLTLLLICRFMGILFKDEYQTVIHQPNSSPATRRQLEGHLFFPGGSHPVPSSACRAAQTPFAGFGNSSRITMSQFQHSGYRSDRKKGLFHANPNTGRVQFLLKFQKDFQRCSNFDRLTTNQKS